MLVADTARVLAAIPDEPLGREADDRRARLRHAGDRADFTAARLLAAVAHCALTGAPLAAGDIVQRCDACGGPHGRPLPSAVGIHLSWSHAHGRVAAAAALDRLGVDVDAPVRPSGELLAQTLSPTERRIVAASADPDAVFLLAWTAKEALVKAGAADLDALAALTVLAGDGEVVPRHGGLAVACRRFSGSTASAATPQPALWRTIDDSGHLTPLPEGTVGGAA